MVRAIVVVILVLIVLVTAVMLVRSMSARDALFAVADRGDAPALKAALTPENIDVTDKWGWTLLMHSASRGHYDACAVLLAAGADVARKDPEGYSALDYANTSLHLASPEERERTAASLKRQGFELPGVDMAKPSPLDPAQLLRVKQLLETRR